MHSHLKLFYSKVIHLTRQKISLGFIAHFQEGETTITLELI